MDEEAGRQIILVVDDDPATRFILEDSLAEWGYDVISAANGNDVWKVLHEEAPPPDLILLDVMMPGINGYDLCERLKEDEKTRDIPVVFITRKSKAEDETRGFEMGALEHNYLSEDELLNLTIRKGSITEKERKIMQRHAAVTLKMLKKIPFTRRLKNIPNFAGAHHERPDGNGYPWL